MKWTICLLLLCACKPPNHSTKAETEAFDRGVLLGISAGIDCYQAKLLGQRPDLETDPVTKIFEYVKTNRLSAPSWQYYHP